MKRQRTSNRQGPFSDRWLGTSSLAERRVLGQWATPWWIVKACIDAHSHDLPPRPIIVDPCCGDGRWLVGAAQRHPGARLYGYDIDPEMIALAKRALADHGIDAHLEVADTLAEEHTMPRADLVVGNPPFVRPQTLPKPRRRDLWRRFSTATDKADLYACFVERALSISHELMVTRRLYAIEFWIATAGLSIYLALTEIGPRLRGPSFVGGERG